MDFMDFCVTNNRYNTRIKQFNHSVRLTGDYYLYFNNTQYYIETNKHIILFCGILWNQEPEILLDEIYNTDILNGQFYAIVFDKQRDTLTVITDFLEDFSVYYYHDTDNLIVTNNYLSFSPNHFDINSDWFVSAIDERIVDIWLPSIKDIPHNNQIYYDDNITPISKVLCAGPARVLKFCLSTNRILRNFRYYKPEIEYPALFKDKERYSYDEALDIAKEALSNNLQKIASSYESITLCCSNGIDSLTTLSHLQDHKNFNILSYAHDFHPRLVEDAEGIKKLHNSLDIPCTIVNFTKEKFINSAFDVFEHCPIPLRELAAAIEGYAAHDPVVKDILVKGTFGDEIFWHGPGSAAAYALHHAGITEFSDLPEYLTNFYNYQPLYTSEYHFDMMKTLDFDASIMSYYYYRHFSYLKEERITSNKLIFSPYIDYKLRSLLPKCDLETQRASLLDVQIQKDIIDPKILKQLASRKYGSEEAIITQFPFVQKDKVINIVKNLVKKELTVSTTYQNILVNILNKDIITFSDMKQLNLAFFINKWVTD